MNAVTTAITAPVVESTPVADSLLNFVARAMADPAIQVDKLEVLLRMQREIVADDARLQFNRAMSAAQGEMVPVVRDAQNSQTNSKYATLERIDAVVRPIYSRHGFCLSFNSEPLGGDGPRERIVCEVSHIAGHTKRYQLEAAPDIAGPNGKANKTALHGLGSMVSYLRRYLTCMIFNITLANEDNDGNRASRNAGLLSEAQFEELSALMRRTGTTEAKFLHAMCPDLRTLGEALAADFPRLKNALLSKASVLEQRAARGAANRKPTNGDARP